MKHFDIGKLFGLALLGLQAYAAQDAPGSGGPKIFLNPATAGQLLGGVLNILTQHAQATQQAEQSAPGTLGDPLGGPAQGAAGGQ